MYKRKSNKYNGLLKQNKILTHNYNDIAQSYNKNNKKQNIDDTGTSIQVCKTAILA